MDYGNFTELEKLPSCKSAIYRPRTSYGVVTENDRGYYASIRAT